MSYSKKVEFINNIGNTIKNLKTSNLKELLNEYEVKFSQNSKKSELFDLVNSKINQDKVDTKPNSMNTITNMGGKKKKKANKESELNNLKEKDHKNHFFETEDQKLPFKTSDSFKVNKNSNYFKKKKKKLKSNTLKLKEGLINYDKERFLRPLKNKKYYKHVSHDNKDSGQKDFFDQNVSNVSRFEKSDLLKKDEIKSKKKQKKKRKSIDSVDENQKKKIKISPSDNHLFSSNTNTLCEKKYSESDKINISFEHEYETNNLQLNVQQQKLKKLKVERPSLLSVGSFNLSNDDSSVFSSNDIYSKMNHKDNFLNEHSNFSSISKKKKNESSLDKLSLKKKKKLKLNEIQFKEKKKNNYFNKRIKSKLRNVNFGFKNFDLLKEIVKTNYNKFLNCFFLNLFFKFLLNQWKKFQDLFKLLNFKTINFLNLFLSFLLWIILSVIISFCFWFRFQQYLIGYCGNSIFIPTFSHSDNFLIKKFGDYLDSNLKPNCYICPPNATCYENLKLSCHDDFIIFKPYSNFLMPYNTKCIPDTKKARKLELMYRNVLNLLRSKNAEIKCGNENSIEKSGIRYDDLRQTIFNTNFEFLNDDFNNLWKKIIENLKNNTEIEISYEDVLLDEEKTTQFPLTHKKIKLIRSKSIRNINFVCRIKLIGTQIFFQHKILMSIFLFSYPTFKFVKYRYKMHEKKKKIVNSIYKEVIKKLKLQSELAYDSNLKKKINPYISSIQLRDLILFNENNLKRRMQIWNLVTKKIDQDSNVNSKLTESHGEFMNVWEWISDFKG